MRTAWALFSLSYIFFAQATLFAQSLTEPVNIEQKESLVIVVRGASLERPLQQVPMSASVLGEREIANHGSSDVQNILDVVPNLNWAGGTARPRFFQIRGIGELEQYDGAPNSSVGFIVDDVNVSGLGSPGALFDVDQVEVLRGPQSIRFGSSALAGTLTIHSSDPTPYFNGKIEGTTGSDELLAGGLAVGGPIDGTDKKLQFRVSAYRSYENGFRNSVFLSRDNTNKRDETTIRSKIRFLPTSSITADLSYFYVDANNGYDAFAIDNSRTMQSDNPGRDAVGNGGGVLKLTKSFPQSVTLISTTTASHISQDYSYDGDWGNNPFWGQFAPYNYFSATFRTRSTISQEVRALSNDKDYVRGQKSRWLLGIYGERMGEDADIFQYSDSQVFDSLGSRYTARTAAGFGEYEVPLGYRSALTYGVRLERRASQYHDSREAKFNPSNNMLGGSATLTHDYTDNSHVYMLVSRGYKGGGFNADPNVPVNRRIYNPEYLWNFESGIKGSWLNGKLLSNISVFHALRKKEQVKLALQDDPSDPLSFTYITDNAARGRNTGLEAEILAKVLDPLTINAGASLLATNFKDVNNPDGRAQAHAPSWQYGVGSTYQIFSALFARAEVTGKARYYFDDSNLEKTRPYHLLNLSLGYRKGDWELTAWSKNVLDKNYAVRGFFFGDEPPDFPNKRYTQQGDPRSVGVTAVYHF